jgi:hypothetical protein
VVRGAGRNRVGLSTLAPHLLQCLFPALLEIDAKASVDQLDVRSHQAAHHDVADAVVDGVMIVGPVLLHEPALQSELCGNRRHLPRMVRLDAADRDKRIAPLCECVRHEVFHLADLVAAEGKSGIAVVAFRKNLDLSAEVF